MVCIFNYADDVRAFNRLFFFLGTGLFLLPLFTGFAHASELLIPAYFYPDIWNTTNKWYTMCDTAPAQSVVIVNPGSGPGSSISSDYSDVVPRCQNNNINVIGYVDTAYGTRSLNAVKADIDTFYSWYGVDGIFFDQMSSSDTTQSYYEELYDYVHTNAPANQELVVGNMGTAPTTDWALDTPVVDTLVIFEGTHTSFNSFTPPAWVGDYDPTDFAALVYDTGSTDYGSTCSGISNKGIGYQYVTDDNGANPWDTLPPYWTTELSGC